MWEEEDYASVANVELIRMVTCLHVCIHMSSLPSKAREGSHVILGWSYRQL